MAFEYHRILQLGDGWIERYRCRRCGQDGPAFATRAMCELAARQHVCSVREPRTESADERRGWVDFLRDCRRIMEPSR